MIEQLKTLNTYNIKESANELNEFKSKHKEEEYKAAVPPFQFGKAVMKTIDKLNDEKLYSYFESKEVPNKDILLIYRLFLQFTNKDKNEMKNKNDNELWQLIKDKIYSNKKDKLAEHVKELTKDLDLSDQNIKLVDDMTKNCKEKLSPKNFNNNLTTSAFSMLIKELLEYSGIITGKKTPLQMEYKKLEYNLKSYKDKEEKLNKMKDALKK